MKTEPNQKWLTQSEVIQTFGISRSTLFRYEQKGLPYVHVMGRKRYDITDVQTWLETPKVPLCPEGMVDTEALKSYLSISRTTLHRLHKEGLPHQKIGKYNFYALEEVDAWLRERINKGE